MRARAAAVLAGFVLSWFLAAAHRIPHDAPCCCGHTEPSIRCAGCGEPGHHHHPASDHDEARCPTCQGAPTLPGSTGSSLALDHANRRAQLPVERPAHEASQPETVFARGPPRA